jgi:hypothetical protein
VSQRTQLEAKKELRDALGDELLNAEDDFVPKPGTCVPHEARP